MERWMELAGGAGAGLFGGWFIFGEGKDMIMDMFGGGGGPEEEMGMGGPEEEYGRRRCTRRIFLGPGEAEAAALWRPGTWLGKGRGGGRYHKGRWGGYRRLGRYRRGRGYGRWPFNYGWPRRYG